MGLIFLGAKILGDLISCSPFFPLRTELLLSFFLWFWNRFSTVPNLPWDQFLFLPFIYTQVLPTMYRCNFSVNQVVFSYLNMSQLASPADNFVVPSSPSSNRSSKVKKKTERIMVNMRKAFLDTLIRSEAHAHQFSLRTIPSYLFFFFLFSSSVYRTLFFFSIRTPTNLVSINMHTNLTSKHFLP